VSQPVEAWVWQQFPRALGPIAGVWKLKLLESNICLFVRVKCDDRPQRHGSGWMRLLCTTHVCSQLQGKPQGQEHDSTHEGKQSSRSPRGKAGKVKGDAAEAYRPNHRGPILVCKYNRHHRSTNIENTKSFSSASASASASHSPLFGYRQHELSQDASHATCKPGESPRDVSSRVPTLDDRYTRHPPHRGVCHIPHATWHW
jgi:hypothetical protein